MNRIKYLKRISELYELYEQPGYFLSHHIIFFVLSNIWPKLLHVKYKIHIPLGFDMYVTPYEEIQRRIYLNGCYEYFTSKLFVSYLKRKMTVLDVGASNGFFSFLASRCVGLNGEVHAFEPEPNNYLQLCENIRLNKSKNIQTNQTALFDQNGYATLYVSEPVLHQENSGLASLRKQKSFLQGKEVPIKTITIDKYVVIKKIKRINLLKIDTEGSELFVLEGARKSLKRRIIDMVVFEYSPILASKFGYNPQDIIDFIKKFNYVVVSMIYKNGKIQVVNGMDSTGLRYWEPLNIIAYNPKVKLAYA